MKKTRLEAFSDGVLAIIITIMVLELEVPHGEDLAALTPLLPKLLAYALSFTYIGIYWNNHHHLLHAARGVNAGIMWANLHLLFWLSIVPFVTGWVGEHPNMVWPTALYGAVMILAAIAYTILQVAVVKQHGADSELARGLGSDVKGKLSLAGYAAGIVFAFVLPAVSYAIYVTVALMWLIPDRRVLVQQD
jgi:uncharacterized membrane protein